MVGIQDIGFYIPDFKISNFDRKQKYGIDDAFIEEKLGIRCVAVKSKDEETSDLCVKAFRSLQAKVDINKDSIQLIVVVTQNPDVNIPHTSAILHGKLDLPHKCASFDISLGCSGYVYGLSIVHAFMKENDIYKALLFTCDPYSKIVDEEDKNTSLLFGDAASVTLISSNPLYSFGKMTYGTIGKGYKELTCTDGKLYMNGRSVFNFAAQYVPPDILDLLRRNGMNIDDIDKYIFHQGSKYIVDTLIKRTNLARDKVAYDIYNYGNTVSSSIPIILQEEIKKSSNRTMLLSGFGVGLSWASMLVNRI